MDSGDDGGGADVRTAAAGLVSAVVAGVFGGLVLAPMKYAPSDQQGLPYVGSMGPGPQPAGPGDTRLVCDRNCSAACEVRCALQVC